jgi:hypothetical protein
MKRVCVWLWLWLLLCVAAEAKERREEATVREMEMEEFLSGIGWRVSVDGGHVRDDSQAADTLCLDDICDPLYPKQVNPLFPILSFSPSFSFSLSHFLFFSPSVPSSSFSLSPSILRSSLPF